jgi:hypothetical protein
MAKRSMPMTNVDTNMTVIGEAADTPERAGRVASP